MEGSIGDEWKQVPLGIYCRRNLVCISLFTALSPLRVAIISKIYLFCDLLHWTCDFPDLFHSFLLLFYEWVLVLCPLPIVFPFLALSPAREKEIGNLLCSSCITVPSQTLNFQV